MNLSLHLNPEAPADSRVTITFRYDPALIADLKAKVPGRRYNGTAKCWTAPHTRELVAWAESHGVPFEPAPEPKPEVRSDGGVAYANWPTAAPPAWKTAIKNEYDGFWDSDSRSWVIPLTNSARRFLGIPIPDAFTLPPAQEPDCDICAGLYAHQRQVVQAVINGHRRFLITDEPGLGKTAEALAGIHHYGARRALVVTPAGVRRSWAAEVRRVLGVEPVVVEKASQMELPDEGIVIMGYAAFQGRGAETLVEAVNEWGPTALVLDESHYIKSATSKRTANLLRLGERMSPGDLVMLLTGTPTPAWAADLIPQLDMLGWLTAFGGRTKFLRTHCPPGRAVGVHRGAELAQTLSELGLVRRTKDEVLDLPERVIADVQVGPPTGYANNTARIIRELARDIASEAGDCAVTHEHVRRAVGRYLASSEGQVSMAELVRDVGMSKVPAAVEKAEELLEAGLPVVIMAHHVSVQQALADGLKKRAVGRLTANQTNAERERTINAFQSGQLNVLVCSIQSAGIGITLTAASNIILAELPWTEATQTQAIDRIHRIGQSSRVTAWRVCCPGTTDDTMRNRILRRGNMGRAILAGASHVEAGASTWEAEYLTDLMAREMALTVDEPEMLEIGSDEGSIF